MSSIQLSSQWPRSQVKTGGINIEKIEGVGYGEGLCPPQLGVWGLVSEKKICAKNYAILSKFWYFFPILQQKVVGLSPSPESGGSIPLPPLLRRLWEQALQTKTQIICSPPPPMLKRNRRHVNQVPRYSYCSMCCILYDSTL